MRTPFLERGSKRKRQLRSLLSHGVSTLKYGTSWTRFLAYIGNGRLSELLKNSSKRNLLEAHLPVIRRKHLKQRHRIGGVQWPRQRARHVKRTLVRTYACRSGKSTQPMDTS